MSAEHSNTAPAFLRFGNGALAPNVAAFLDRIRQLWPSPATEPVSPELLELVERAITEFPQSARLWCRLGDILQLGADSALGVDSAFDCYKKAIEIDPLCGEAYEELGFLCDLNDDPTCLVAFEMAIRCDGCLESYLALARKYAEQGNVNRANACLSEASQWFTAASRRIDELKAEFSETG